MDLKLHPDSGQPNISPDDLAAVKASGKYIGSSDPVKDCSWVIYQLGERFFIFLNEVSAYGWEVSKQGAVHYNDYPA